MRMSSLKRIIMKPFYRYQKFPPGPLPRGVYYSALILISNAADSGYFQLVVLFPPSMSLLRTASFVATVRFCSCVNLVLVSNHLQVGLRISNAFSVSIYLRPTWQSSEPVSLGHFFWAVILLSGSQLLKSYAKPTGLPAKSDSLTRRFADCSELQYGHACIFVYPTTNCNSLGLDFNLTNAIV
jgi:hypothetical protein